MGQGQSDDGFSVEESVLTLPGKESTVKEDKSRLGSVAVEAESLVEDIERLIGEHLEARRKVGAVVGLSGGVDSAVVSALACRALGADKVWAVTVVERTTPNRVLQNATLVASHFGVCHRVLDASVALDSIDGYSGIPQALRDLAGLSTGAVRDWCAHQTSKLGCNLFLAQLRGRLNTETRWVRQASARVHLRQRHIACLVNYFAERENLLVLGCLNRTEKLIGLFVRHAEQLADLAPIELLYKTQVIGIARFLGVPEAVIRQRSFSDAMPGFTKEQVVGLDYQTLDRILWRIETGMPGHQIAEDVGGSIDDVHLVAELVASSAHMRETLVTPSLSHLAQVGDQGCSCGWMPAGGQPASCVTSTQETRQTSFRA